VLTKSTKEEEVTSYSWVVEEICPICAGACGPGEIVLPEGETAPQTVPAPVPQSDATQPFGHWAEYDQARSPEASSPSALFNFGPDSSSRQHR
jgi:hypothetical protein